MTEWETDTEPGRLPVTTRILVLTFMERRHAPTHTNTHSHPRHSQTSLHCKCTFPTLKTIVHFAKWDALELWVITGAHNQPEWADIIGGGEAWRRWDNEGLQGSDDKRATSEAVVNQCSAWQRAEGGLDVMSRVLFNELDSRDCVCLCLCARGSMSTNQINETAGWWKTQVRKACILSRRRCHHVVPYVL